MKDEWRKKDLSKEFGNLGGAAAEDPWKHSGVAMWMGCISKLKWLVNAWGFSTEPLDFDVVLEK